MRAPLQILFIALATALLLAAAALGVALSGRVAVGAVGKHDGPLEWFLETARDRSVELRASGVEVPDLSDPARRERGEALYRRHCALCHGGADDPSGRRSAVARGLDPPPPDLSRGIPSRDAAEAWWITSNGIRMTGMPSFCDELSAQEIWDLVAWLTRQ